MKMTDEMCNHFFEQLPIELKQWLVSIVMEYNHAIEKHPEWPEDIIHRAAIVSEESGELVRAALQHTYEKGQYYQMHREAMQTGAMCLRFLLETKELVFNEEGDGSGEG